MARDTARTHVNHFLATIDPRGGFVRVAEMIVEAAEKEEEVRKSLGAVADWLGDLPIDEEAISLHRRIRRHSIRPDLPGSSEGKTLLAVAYLKAIEGLRSGVTSQQLDPSVIKKRLTDLPIILKNLEPEFVSELLIETDVRAIRDLEFARQLEGALENLQELSPQLADTRGKLQSLLQFGNSPQVTPQSPNVFLKKRDLWDALYTLALLVVVVAFEVTSPYK